MNNLAWAIIAVALATCVNAVTLLFHIIAH